MVPLMKLQRWKKSTKQNCRFGNFHFYIRFSSFLCLIPVVVTEKEEGERERERKERSVMCAMCPELSSQGAFFVVGL